MSTTRLQEVQICFGFGKQTDIATANLVAAMWRLKKLNAQLANPKLNTENDAEEYGKGHEFATQTFKTSWDTGGTLEKYLSAEMAAWAMCFGLGKVVKSGTTPNFIYTCTPLIPSNGDADGTAVLLLRRADPPRCGRGARPAWRSGAPSRHGRSSIGSGPGRANSKITVEFHGSGQAHGAFRHHHAGRDG